MNSVLQALYFCKPFRDKLIEYKIAYTQRMSSKEFNQLTNNAANATNNNNETNAYSNNSSVNSLNEAAPSPNHAASVGSFANGASATINRESKSNSPSVLKQ